MEPKTPDTYEEQMAEAKAPDTYEEQAAEPTVPDSYEEQTYNTEAAEQNPEDTYNFDEVIKEDERKDEEETPAQKNIRDFLGSAYYSQKNKIDTFGEEIEEEKDLPSEEEVYPFENFITTADGYHYFDMEVMTQKRIYACRDKYGLRPLSLGKLGDGYVVSSETCAFSTIGAEFIRDIEPGEIVTIDHHGIRSRRYSEYQRHAMCAMEYIYFARPDSDIESMNVHTFRKESGKLLFKESPADADIVVGVPDSSLSAAMGYAEASGLPYEMGLIKNKYIGRTFIQPSQEMRDKGVKMKLSPVLSIVSGKRVVLIDDSIVRGTTSLRIVRMLREAGATEVHVRIASPMIKFPCFYGVDISTYDELLCARRTLEEARQKIEADSLAFLSESALYEAGKRSDLCLACFSGVYPTALYSSLEDANKDGKF